MVIDSSVIFKWFFNEEGTPQALALYRKIKEAKIDLAVPRLLFYEMGNIFLYHQPYSSQKNRTVREILNTLPVSFYDFDFYQWSEIIEEAHKMRISFYDCAYLYLAKLLNTSLITADKKLFRQTKSLGIVQLL